MDGLAVRAEGKRQRESTSLEFCHGGFILVAKEGTYEPCCCCCCCCFCIMRLTTIWTLSCFFSCETSHPTPNERGMSFLRKGRKGGGEGGKKRTDNVGLERFKVLLDERALFLVVLQRLLARLPTIQEEKGRGEGSVVDEERHAVGGRRGMRGGMHLGHKVARPDVDDDVFHVGQLAGHVQRARQGDQDRSSWIGGGTESGQMISSSQEITPCWTSGEENKTNGPSGASSPERRSCSLQTWPGLA